MSRSSLSVLTMPKALSGKQSLSCSDIAVLTTEQEQLDTDHQIKRRPSLVRATETILQRFVRSKSPSLFSSSERHNRGYGPKKRRSASVSDLDDVDKQLMQIREQLSMFREQNLEFRRRLHSLDYSIEELASRSSLASDSLDLRLPSDDSFEENDCEEHDDAIENNQKNVSISFSSEVFHRIPSITVTVAPYRTWQSSDQSMAT